MGKRRVAWLLTLAAALLLYLFENGGGTRALLLSILLLPMCAGAALLLPCRAPSLQLEVPPSARRGQRLDCSLRLTAASFWPLSRVSCPVQVENLLTGEKSSLDLSLPSGRREIEANFTVAAAHCGALRLHAGPPRLLDPFGLFARRLPCRASAAILVLPESAPIALSLADTADFLQDSERYSLRQPGYDPSEVFQIREYAPGDPVRQIHWKLSQKTEAVLVRDFGLPVVDRLLILLETAPTPAGAVTPEDMDAQLDLLSSLAQALFSLDLPFSVGWQWQASGQYRECEQLAPEDWPELLSLLLSQPIEAAEADVVGAYLFAHPQCAYAHVAVLSPYPSPEFAQLLRGNRVTLLSPRGTDSPMDPVAVPYALSELRSGDLSLEL